VIQDLRYAARMLLRSRGFTAIAILSLALGIGANTAIFTLINAVILRSLPVRHPERLFALSRSNRGNTVSGFSYLFYRELRSRKNLFSGVVFERTIAPSLSTHGNTQLVRGEAVSGDYFDVLGIRPYAGRLLHSYDETAAGANRVVVLSYRFWKDRFGGDPSIMGKTIRLNTTPMTVIGISSPSYKGLRAGVSPDICVPITMWPQMMGDTELLPSPKEWYGFVVGRLKPKVSPKRAESALTVSYRDFMRSTFSRKSERASVWLKAAATGLDSKARRTSKQLYILMAVVGIVLLAACVNLANLLLARTASRQHEIAVRLSLGAGRFRIVRQLLTESVLLAGMGGALGLVVAYWGARLLFTLLMGGQFGPSFGASMDVSPDRRVLLFTLAASVITGILFGLAPALRSTRFNLTAELKGERIRLPGTRITLQKALVAAQFALSLLLLIGAGLFLQSLKNLYSVHLGFDPHNVLAIEVDPMLAGYKQNRMHELYREAQDRVSQVPGIVSASFGMIRLMGNLHWRSGIRIPGYEPQPDDPGPYWDIVGPGYFKTLRMPIIRGRGFTPQDTQNAPHVAVVNQSFARFYFGDQNPIGKLIGPGKRHGPADYEIVGVAKDAKYASLTEQTPRYWYIPYQQHSEIDDSLVLYARTRGDPMSEVNAVRQAIRSADPNVPVFHPRTLEEQIESSIARYRMVALCSSFFSLLAALLAGIGLYGAMTYAVVRRTREIGIRMALGAQTSDVVWPLMTEIALMVAVGATAGVLCAMALGRFIASMLFELKPADPFALSSACLFLVIIALIAGYLPARRAARIDPMVALRYE
jgi:predicted permease